MIDTSVVVVVSGDDDLLILGRFQGTRIVTPIEAVEHIHNAD